MKKNMSWLVSGILMLSVTVVGGTGLITTMAHGWS